MYFLIICSVFQSLSKKSQSAEAGGSSPPGDERDVHDATPLRSVM